MLNMFYIEVLVRIILVLKILATLTEYRHNAQRRGIIHEINGVSCLTYIDMKDASFYKRISNFHFSNPFVR